MAPEIPVFKKPQLFPINWAGSKEHISKYVVACGANEVVGMMLYDLGHHGRSFSDFGLNDKPVTLRFTQGKFLESGRTLEAYSPTGLFLTQIVSSIEKYEPEKTAWSRDISLLHDLINEMDANIMIALVFGELDDHKRRSLTSITEI